MAALLVRLSVLRQPFLTRCISASSGLLIKRPTLNHPLPPKKPGSAYSLFVKDHSQGQFAVTATLWKELDDDKRKEYDDLYEERKKAYEKSLKRFYASLGDGKEEYLKDVKKYKQKLKEFRQKMQMQKLGILKPRKPNPVNIYTSRLLKGSKKEDLPDKFADVSKEWKSMADSVKEAYKKEAEAMYLEQMAEYERRRAELQKIMTLPGIKKPAPAKKAKKAKKAKVKSAGKGKKKAKAVNEKHTSDDYEADDDDDLQVDDSDDEGLAESDSDDDEDKK